MKRLVPIGTAGMQNSWSDEPDAGDTGANPGVFAFEGTGPVISEVNDNSVVGCDFVEIACPGGHAVDFCTAIVDLCYPSDTMETCLESLAHYGTRLVTAGDVACAQTAGNCVSTSDCWGSIL
jgi:hypothetical protein